jgi:integrase/recombinase XerD
MVNEIVLEHIYHKDKLRLFLKFDYDARTIELVKSLADARWSNSHKAWYITHYDGAIALVKTTFQKHNIIVKQQNIAEEINRPMPEVIKKPTDALAQLSIEAKLQLKQFIYWMRSRRYSENTINTYTEALETFLRYFAQKPIPEITNEDLISFNNHYILENHFSSSYQNQVVNAVKLFFRSVVNKKLQPDLILRPKRPKLLPNILSKEEVKLILNAHSNIKHKAMLSLIYSCGLRRGELLNLKLSDIDSNRGLIMVRQAKGKKDRIVPLSEKILLLLRQYFMAYKPKDWLFEGQDKANKYDEASLAAVLKLAVEKSNISKPVTLHWLRHSYATHLLENGTDLRYIQEILGHSRSTTTEIYTHVSNKSIRKVISPFDSL